MSRKTSPATWHFLDLYNVNLHLAVTRPQLRDMLATFESMDDPTADDRQPAAATSGHLGYSDGAQSYHVAFWFDRAMWRRSGARPASLANICAHEATHGAGMIWRHIGATLDHDTLRDDEPMAYLIGWLTEWIAEAVVG